MMDLSNFTLDPDEPVVFDTNITENALLVVVHNDGLRVELDANGVWVPVYDTLNQGGKQIRIVGTKVRLVGRGLGATTGTIGEVA